LHISCIILYNCYSSYAFVDAYTPSPCFTPICFKLFFFKASYQFTPLLNLCTLVFSPGLFGLFVSIYIRLFPEGIIVCDLYPIFQQHILGLNKVLVCIPTFIYLFVVVYAYVPASVCILYGERWENIHIFYLIQRIIYS